MRARLITDNILERRQAFYAMMYEVTPFDRSFNPPEVSCFSARLCKSHCSMIQNSPYSRTCQPTITILFGLNVPIPSGSHEAAVTAFATFGPRSIPYIAILPRVTRLDSVYLRNVSRVNASSVRFFCYLRTSIYSKT